MSNSNPILIRVGDAHDQEFIVAEEIANHSARLIQIPMRHTWLSIFDIVHYDPASAAETDHGTSYPLQTVLEHSGYSAFPTWAVHHRAGHYEEWAAEQEVAGIVVQEGEWITRAVRKIWVAIPPGMSVLSALIRFNRAARTIEIIAPTLAAAADDLDRAKSDLERAVAWGASDTELTYALAMNWESQEQIDDAIVFWERLSYLLPDDVSVRERLAASYARLGVFPHAAAEFDRAATLAEDPAVRLRLEAARDMMWQKSKT